MRAVNGPIYRGTFSGKQVFTFDPQIDCSENDLDAFLGSRSRLNLLRALCDISKASFHSLPRGIPDFKGIPLLQEVLLFCVKKIVQQAQPSLDTIVTENEIILILRMGHCLWDKSVTSKTYNPQEILMSLGYSQYTSQANMLTEFSRSYYVYTELWPTVPQANSINAALEIEKIIGLSYEIAILFTFALMGSRQSYDWPYNEDTTKYLAEATGLSIKHGDSATFFKWCSCSFEEIIHSTDPLNILITKPVIRTDSSPNPTQGVVHLLPSSNLLHNKITAGIYFMLSDKFKGEGRRNPFREAYGYVFQEYVGKLIHAYFRKAKVLTEFKYDKNKRDSVDWLILDGKQLILLEVKQSSIFFNAKVHPTKENINQDIRSTVLKAAEQLSVFSKHIRSGVYSELSFLTEVTDIVSLIVVGEPLYNENNIIKGLVREKLSDTNFSFDIINISDLEFLLANQADSESLFSLLFYKNLSPEHKNMDFNEYLPKMYPDSIKRVDFLENIYKRFFEKINIDKSQVNLENPSINP